MLQEHGLGARPYDCSKCTLKFFFRAELDHHMLTFHRPGDASSPTENVQNANETKTRDTEERVCDEEITVKEELLPDAAEEDEEINVDEQVEQDDPEKDKPSDVDKKLKTELEGDSITEKIDS